MAFGPKIKYDRVTVHFTGEEDPMVVERVTELAKSIFPGSRDPALQIMDDPRKRPGGGLFDVDVILVGPSEIDYLVLQEREEERTAELEELFPEWDWQSS